MALQVAEKPASRLVRIRVWLQPEGLYFYTPADFGPGALRRTEGDERLYESPNRWIKQRRDALGALINVLTGRIALKPVSTDNPMHYKRAPTSEGGSRIWHSRSVSRRSNRKTECWAVPGDGGLAQGLAPHPQDLTLCCLSR